MDNERCKRIVSAIQNLEPTEIMELFRLLHKCKCEYTRNNNGIFINLSWVSPDMLDRIEQYVAFCSKSHNEVLRYESICDVLNKNMIDNKVPHAEGAAETDSGINLGESINRYDKKQVATKMSSSMRFYLLKKRFAKQVPLATNAKNDLSYDPYIL